MWPRLAARGVACVGGRAHHCRRTRHTVHHTRDMVADATPLRRIVVQPPLAFVWLRDVLAKDDFGSLIGNRRESDTSWLATTVPASEASSAPICPSAYKHVQHDMMSIL